MIQWIIAFFYFLNELNILNPEEILPINLWILIICRGFYSATYLLNYYTKRGTENLLLSRRELAYFSAKQLLMVLFGMLLFPITAFIAFYSLIMAGNYLYNHASDKPQVFFKIFGRSISLISPIIGILWFSFIEVNPLVIAAIALSLVSYLFYGLKNSNLSLGQIIDKYKNRRIEKIPKALQYAFLLVLISTPLLFTVGTYVHNPYPKQSFMVPMADGAELATDVYFSLGSFGTPKPVILIRTPYGKSGWAQDLYLPIYYLQDYHVVIQDLRGTGASGGGTGFLLFVNSYLDGVDTIYWILNQSWCNGKIASVGVSALCINQYFYAGMGPDGLFAQQLWFGTPELFDHAIFQGSYHKSSVETWITSTSPSNAQYQIDMLFTTIPKDETLYNSTSLSIPIGPHYSNVSAYGIHVGGWYDHFLQGTLDGYVGYDDLGKSSAKGHQKLIMGPWTHGSIYGGKQGELTYPENSNGFNLILDWETEIFDEALLGIPAKWDAARVAYYLMGDVDIPSEEWNYWRYAYDWPLDHVDEEWFLTSDGGLSKMSSGLTNKNFSYLFDPRFPVPNLGGQNQPFDLAGPMDQTPIEDRSDVLIFETPVLTEAVETVGRIFGHLWIASNCTDTDFTLKLTDVYPDNRSMLITDGSLTVRFRDNYTSESLISGNPNDAYELFIDCWSTAYKFAPGHKIRITISSSNYPRFAINPNTGVPLAREYLNFNIANNSILVGPQYNSSINLPRLVNMSTTHVSY